LAFPATKALGKKKERWEALGEVKLKETLCLVAARWRRGEGGVKF